MKNFLVALCASWFVVGCTPSQQETNMKMAYSLTSLHLQDKQGLFKDQYELSMPFDNDRGSIVVAEITDEKLIQKGGSRYIAHIFTKRQETSVGYLSGYTMVRMKEKPTKDKIEELAANARFR